MSYFNLLRSKDVFLNLTKLQPYDKDLVCVWLLLCNRHVRMCCTVSITHPLLTLNYVAIPPVVLRYFNMEKGDGQTIIFTSVAVSSVAKCKWMALLQDRTALYHYFLGNYMIIVDDKS